MVNSMMMDLAELVERTCLVCDAEEMEGDEETGKKCKNCGAVE